MWNITLMDEKLPDCQLTIIVEVVVLPRLLLLLMIMMMMETITMTTMMTIFLNACSC